MLPQVKVNNICIVIDFMAIYPYNYYGNYIIFIDNKNYNTKNRYVYRCSEILFHLIYTQLKNIQ